MLESEEKGRNNKRKSSRRKTFRRKRSEVQRDPPGNTTNRCCCGNDNLPISSVTSATVKGLTQAALAAHRMPGAGQHGTSQHYDYCRHSDRYDRKLECTFSRRHFNCLVLVFHRVRILQFFRSLSSIGRHSYETSSLRHCFRKVSPPGALKC
jgi:hypothetical protein